MSPIRVLRGVLEWSRVERSGSGIAGEEPPRDPYGPRGHVGYADRAIGPGAPTKNEGHLGCSEKRGGLTSRDCI